jgi:hypothetical protein
MFVDIASSDYGYHLIHLDMFENTVPCTNVTRYTVYSTAKRRDNENHDQSGNACLIFGKSMVRIVTDQELS